MPGSSPGMTEIGIRRLEQTGNTIVQFQFSNHVLDAGLRELTRGGEAIPVEPQVFDLLVYLVENRDRVVSKDDLIERIWNGRIVSESTLTSRINAARTAVGDSGKDQAVIRTIARKGFRFVGQLNAPRDALTSQPLTSPSQGASQLPQLDLIHLGLGDDGHTASLVPGDPVLDVTDRSVAVTGEYRGHRRMTLTYPVLDGAVEVLWIVAGEGKRDAVAKLVAGDRSVPAGRVANEHMLLVVDEAAAG